MERLQLKLSDEGKAALDNLANLQNRQVADVVRDALSKYFHDMGINVEFSPGKWGGSRKDSKRGQE